MRRFGRRWFLGSSAAVWCVGCSSDSSDPSNSSDPSGASDDGTTEPAERGGGQSPFLAPIGVGRLGDVVAAASSAPMYVPEARAWLVGLDAEQVAIIAADADDALLPGLEHGLLALSQKCPHLGCRVPYCESSGWFECPCHAALFTRTGEHRAGPSRRGMDALVIRVDADEVSIDAAGFVVGAPSGTVVVDQPAEGPHCTGATDAGDG